MAELEQAAKAWRAAKKKERAARDALAQVVLDMVHTGRLSESKVASTTKIPRMTIRKMLGKDDSPSGKGSSKHPA